MITCQLKGGLGNQMFQIFAIIAYALRHKVPFKFIYSKSIPSITPRNSYWDTFFKSLRFFTIRQVPPSLKLHQHNMFTYEEIPSLCAKEENICLNGYFQSYKYFEQYKDDIYRLIQLNPQQKKIHSKHNIGDLTHSIAIHFRLGDYKHLQHTHPILNVHYYINALTTILSKTTTQKFRIIYFCEKEDAQYVKDTYISNIETIFPSLCFERASDDMEDWEQLLVMSMCTHNIIANSSFSWFGAYFNTTSKNKYVCYPNVWFAGEAAKNDTKDLFPPHWKKITF